MIELKIGTRYLTSVGPATCMGLTPYQAQMQPLDGNDPFWCQRTNVQELVESEIEREPSILELLDNAAACIEIVRARLRCDPPRAEQEVGDAKR